MYLVKHIKEMDEIKLKQTFFYCSDIFSLYALQALDWYTCC